MTSRTSWTAGNGVGLTWSTAINSSDLASLSASYSVLSSVADIANGSNLDIFCDLSVEVAASSSTTTAGQNYALYLYALLDNGSQYGDGQFASGTPNSKSPTVIPCAIIPLPATTSTQSYYGFAQGIQLPPGSFRFLFQNNASFALSGGTQTVKYRTYNTNLND